MTDAPNSAKNAASQIGASGARAGTSQGNGGPGGSTPSRLPPGRPGGGPPWMSMGMPTEKSLNFMPSAKRLFQRLRPQKLQVVLVIFLAIASVTCMVIGPKILGHGTDLIFAGIIGKHLPSNVTIQQVIAHDRAHGEGRIANLLAAENVTPGKGIDFTQLGHVLVFVLCLYLVASILAYLQGFLLTGIVQGTVLQLRADVEAKLNRLPLPYFDRQPRGEILSRVTNDIDNIAQTLQQTLSQLFTSVLTVVGVLVLMFIISPISTLR